MTSSEGTPLKLERLRSIVRDMQSVLVCYSGGIDSAFVLAIAHEQLGERALGLTATSPSLPASEREDASRIAAQLGAAHYFVESQEIHRPGYAANGPDRCFHCKSELYDIAVAERHKHGLLHIANGTNCDDLGDYRPGLEAAKNASVRSPLIEAEMTKGDVRTAARQIGMAVWDKPASACLSSRIPYGHSVTPERLAQVGSLEAELKRLGFRQLRVRWHEKIARIEVALSEIHRFSDPEVRDAVVAAGKRQGFAYITLDLAGYRTGSHNEVLEGRSLRIIS